MMEENDSDSWWDERLAALIAEYLAALERGEAPDQDALLAAHPDLADGLRDFFADHNRMRRLASPAGTFPELTGPYQRSAEPDLAGTVIAGRYKLLQRIGEGGMGAVYMAEQTTPVKRIVAVKLIKPGMDSRHVLARFEAERQALALMDHPNIAKVLDGGTTRGEPGGVGPGRPFFVMELVRGLPITGYCDEKRLSVPQRLDLFRQICSAVQHAHQKGIIHRDLKPTNVLVTEHDGKPMPKVIDFGLAKALHAPGLLTEKTLFTAFGTAVGTPLYMAPEQVGINALDVDTRTDVYALGVMLYELLTGSTPVERQRLKAVAWEEMRRVIREEEPPRPSQRLSTSDGLPSIAACRDTEPAKLGRLVRGDLDWIVMKALEKDRNRRYETATSFAEDVRRFLSDDPVTAGPPTLGYRLRKFVRRNRAAVAVVGIIALGVLLAIGGLGWGLLQTQWALDRVTEEEKKTRAALAEAEIQRQKAETIVASMRIDLDLAEEHNPLRLLRLAETLQSIPEHARELREYLTLKILTEGQASEPLVAFVTPNGSRSFGPSQLSPDGLSLLARAEDDTWQVWETLTGRPVGTLPHEKDGYRFAANGRLFSVQGERIVRLWDTTGQHLLDTAPFPGSIQAVHVSPDHRRILVACDGRNPDGPRDFDKHVELLDAANGRRLAVLGAQNLPVNDVAFSPDGKWVLTGECDRAARVWSTEDGRLVRVLEGHPHAVEGVGINPTGTFAYTTCRTQLRWWRLPDWQPAGPPMRGGGNQTGVFLQPDIVAFTFTNNDEEGASWSNLFRQGDRESLGLIYNTGSKEIVAVDGDRRMVLLDTGAIYDLSNEVRLLVPPQGRKFHPDARRILGGRLVIAPSNIIDLATEKRISPWPGQNRDGGFQVITAPSCRCVHHDPKSVIGLMVTPSLDVDIPPATLKLWAQVITRGELTPLGEFLAWDEGTWERKRQELAATARPVGSFPFPGHVATDRPYWLRTEVSAGGHLPDEEATLLDRLVEAEPTWGNYLRRGLFLSDPHRHRRGAAARDFLEAGRLAGPRFWLREAGSANALAGGIARELNLQPDDYEAALTLAGKVPADRSLLNTDLSRMRLKRLLQPPPDALESHLNTGLLLYRLGRYRGGLDTLARMEQREIVFSAAAAFALPWTVARPSPEVRGEDIDREVLKAMCLFRMDQRDAARAQLTLARQVVGQYRCEGLSKGPNEQQERERELQHVLLLPEAEKLIEGKIP